MSKKDIETAMEVLARWERILEKAVETEQHGMKSLAEQKVRQFERILEEQVG